MPRKAPSPLKDLYDEYNKRYFLGALPENCVIEWKPEKKMREGKKTVWGLADVKKGVPIIYLNDIMLKKEWESQMKFTLLHEMNHFWDWRANHTKKSKFDLFDKGMLRLAKLGAFHGLW